MSSQTVAVLGAGGTMGAAMARNIKNAGMQVHAWNRTRERVQPLSQDGITVVDSAAEAADGADVILTMLSDGDAVLATAEQFSSTARDGAIWLQMSTIGIKATERCISTAKDAGLVFVDAPVLGTKQPAEEGKLVVLASGPDEARKHVEPTFDAVGQKTLWIGEAGQGNRLKVVVNVWIVSVVEGAAETLALAEGLGVDPKLFFDAVEGGALDLPYLKVKGTMMMERSFEPSFRLALAAKDARLAAEAAEDAHLDLPLLEAVASRMSAASDDHGDEDLSATFLLSAPNRAQSPSGES
ncbi:MAG TPA: NAD(P)-dependent oxidoreductase [Thermoleophilaceae bacterium]|nr:NAD(P)-dependent oxidoreductase [Thermoleophilaceae bacterium]